MTRRSTFIGEEKTRLYTSGPSIVYVSLLVLGVVFFIELVALSWPGPTVHRVDESDVPTPWYVWLIPALFAGFAGMGLWYLLRLKFIRLYPCELKLIRPFVLYRRSYHLSKSTILDESPFEMKYRDNGTEWVYYSGLQCTIRFNESQKIKINNLEITHYNALIKQIKRAQNGLPLHSQSLQEYTSGALYWIILFLLVLSIGLGYGLYQR